MISSAKITQSLRSIVGESAVLSLSELGESQPGGIAAAVQSANAIECIVYPQTAAELAEVVTCAHRNHWPLLPLGKGSKLAWGGLADQVSFFLSTARLNRLVDHAAADMTVTAEAGISFAQLQASLAESRQFIALDPLWADQATLGGIVATRQAGSLRHRYGGVRDMCLGIQFVRSDGQRVKAGGRVVKNVAGYDLMKLLTGSFGTLGVITELTFRLYPLPETEQTLLFTGNDRALQELLSTLLVGPLTPTAVDLLSPGMLTAEPGSGQMSVLVQFQGLAASVEQQGERLYALASDLNLQSQSWSEAEETYPWKQVRSQFEQPFVSLNQDAHPSEAAILCQLGVLPNQSVDRLRQILNQADQENFTCKVQLHAGSGLGNLYLEGDLQRAVGVITALRSLCQSSKGFLTVLNAPITLKQNIDLWGYQGNAFELMAKIKQQFDPHRLLSPDRFINGL